MLWMIVMFLAVLAGSFGALMWAILPTKSQKRELERLRGLGTGSTDSETSKPAEKPLLKERHAESHASLEKLLERAGVRHTLLRLLEQADSSSSPAHVILQSVASAVAVTLAAHVFSIPFLVALLAGIAASAMPILVLRFKRARRIKAFNEGLPDAIDMMARALRAGRSVASAIEVIAEQGQKPTSTEFAQVFQQQSFGLPFRDSLLAMSHRVPSQDLHFLITAMLVQKETGGNLTEILDRTTHVIRERIRIHGEVRTKTAQGRLTGWILSALPIIMGVLINLASPGFEKPLFQDPLGRTMLYCGAGMLVVGGLIIRKIVDIEL